MTSMGKQWEAMADQLTEALQYYEHSPVLAACKHCEALDAYEALKARAAGVFMQVTQKEIDAGAEALQASVLGQSFKIEGAVARKFAEIVLVAAAEVPARGLELT